MPIVYIHGVAVRAVSAATFEQEAHGGLGKLLREYVAPAIAPGDPAGVKLFPIYWGDLGVRFAWDGASRPLSPLTGQGAEAELSAAGRALGGAELAEALRLYGPAAGAADGAGGPLSAGAAGAADAGPPIRLKDLSADQLSALLATTITGQLAARPGPLAEALIVADAVARSSQTAALLAGCDSLEAELIVIEGQLVAHEQGRGGALGAMGVAEWFQQAGEALRGGLRWGADTAGFAVARVAVDMARKPLNALATRFTGDVFTYLANRGDANSPGPIPRRALAGLSAARANQRERGGEPLVVLSHSMGGQIIYDMVTHFLPNMPDYLDTRVDFWCASASQVSLFEEMKLFRASSPRYSKFMGNLAPLPGATHLGYWWNVWDHNDVLSFTSNGIFPTRPASPRGVDDEAFNAMMFVGPAHGGYLERPGFFRRLAEKIEAARAEDWGRP